VHALLIAPEGIEMLFPFRRKWLIELLLIAPEGIEISYFADYKKGTVSS